MTLDENTTRLLVGMARAGLPRAAIAAMIDAFYSEALTLEERRYLAGPLVVHANGWTGTVPGWLAEAASAERVGIVLGETPQWIVGPAEIAAVMYPAMLQAPMRGEIVDLYCWATATAARLRNGRPVNLDGLQVPSDADVLSRRGRLHDTYRELARDIRAKVVRAQAEREGADRRQARAQPAPVLSQSPAAAVQVSLFDLNPIGE